MYVYADYLCSVVVLNYTEHPVRNKIHAMKLSFAGYPDFWLFLPSTFAFATLYLM